MKYGQTKYLQCNHCEKPVTIRPLEQVNARMATLWTDGYVDSPMVPEQPLVANCGHCNKPVWLPELQALTAPDVTDAAEYKNLNLVQLQTLLQSYVHQASEHQLHLRIKIWQRHNHRYRNTKLTDVNFDIQHLDNMVKLLDILDMNVVQERLVAVELFRQLGEFGKANRLLHFTQSSLQPEVHLFMKKLISDKSKAVAKVEIDRCEELEAS